MSIHIYPPNDWIDHHTETEDGSDCPCQPDVEYVDEDGMPLDEPIVKHHALDDRQ